MDLIAVFTRRDPKSVVLQSSQVPVVHIDAIDDYKDKIDVMILCGGSATDLPEQSPKFAKLLTSWIVLIHTVK